MADAEWHIIETAGTRGRPGEERASAPDKRGSVIPDSIISLTRDNP
ncbi:MAG TPA: hypothetical protein VMC42_07350 [Methanoregulaceae archaeon]|nr:hypothetical protein [Methanoregulaceae archaeon]